MVQVQRETIRWWCLPSIVAVLGIGLGAWFIAADPNIVNVTITVDISEATVAQLQHRGKACDLARYEIEVFARDVNGERLDSYALEGGWFPDPRSCRFIVRGEVVKHDTYALKIATFPGDPDMIAKSVAIEDVLSQDSDGTDGLTIEVRWYHRENGD